jgi:hypothetical protein
MNAALFSSFSTKPFIEDYILFYLKELTRHYEKVFLITNKRQLPDQQLKLLNDIGITVITVKNEGLDFGMWYKQLKSMDTSLFNEICLVNDSCILFNELDDVISWARRYSFGFFGISKSIEISEHLQSFFIIARGKNTIAIMMKHFYENGVIISDNHRLIIKIYEIGLSQAMKKEGIPLRAFTNINMRDKIKRIKRIISNNIFSNEHKNYIDYFSAIIRVMIGLMNPSIYYAKELVVKGSPMIKKKPILSTFRDSEEKALDKINFNYGEDYTYWLNNWLDNQKSVYRIAITPNKEIIVNKVDSRE